MEYVLRERAFRADRRTWREVLKEYHANAGKHVRVSLPKVKCLEEDEERERAA